jgi:hypothetical protein
MDLFAAVLPTPGYLSIYKQSVIQWIMLMNNVITVKYVCM